MIIDNSKWEEAKDYDVLYRNVTELSPFTLVTEVAHDRTHSFLAMRGTLLTERVPHALNNPYYNGYGYPYYLPHNTVADVRKSFLDMGYTLEAARQAAAQQVLHDRAIALSPHHAGYSAYCVLVTVRLRVVCEGVTDTITLARRSEMGIECKTSPVQAAAIRAEAAMLPFQAERAEGEEAVVNAVNEIEASAERAARDAILASMSIIGHIKNDAYHGQYRHIASELRKSERQIPDR